MEAIALKHGAIRNEARRELLHYSMDGAIAFQYGWSFALQHGWSYCVRRSMRLPRYSINGATA
jgi:hypothetical protein